MQDLLSKETAEQSFGRWCPIAGLLVASAEFASGAHVGRVNFFARPKPMTYNERP